MKWANSLIKRIITAVILIPIILLGILFLTQLAFLIITGLVFLLASLEWPKLMGIDSSFNRLLYVIMMLIVMMASYSVLESSGELGRISIFLYTLIVLWWVCAFFWVRFYNRKVKVLRFNFVIYAALGCVVIIPCWLGINVMKSLSHGKAYLILYLVLIWGADTAAYFGGKAWGNRKLAPNVSPNKTLAGVYSALALTVLIALLGSLCLPISNSLRLGFMMVAIITVLFSIVGDLFISVLKRQQGLKDSGTLLPGHGGLLDRIDSLTASAPIYIIGLLLIGLR